MGLQGQPMTKYDVAGIDPPVQPVGGHQRGRLRKAARHAQSGHPEIRRSFGFEHLLGFELGAVIDRSGLRRGRFIDPRRTVRQSRCVPVQRRGAGKDQRFDAHSTGGANDGAGAFDIDLPKFGFRKNTDMRCVQSGGVDDRAAAFESTRAEIVVGDVGQMARCR